MNKKTVLRSSSYPEAMRSFAEENLNLKFLCASLLGLFFITLLLVLYLVKKGPTVVALDNTGEVSRIEAKVTDLQIQAAIKEYVSRRYSWNEKSISSQLVKAKFFVLPMLVPAFERSMADVQKFVRDKKVSQRVYPKSVEVDLKEKKVSVIADRITEFDNLKAATEMRLVLQFALDDRTVTNPWGIYISRESEEARP